MVEWVYLEGYCHLNSEVGFKPVGLGKAFMGYLSFIELLNPNFKALVLAHPAAVSATSDRNKITL